MYFSIFATSVAQSLPDVSGKVGAGGSDWGSVLGGFSGCFTDNNLGGRTSVAARPSGHSGGFDMSLSTTCDIYKENSDVIPNSVKTLICIKY